ncbi:PQQ-binding-like beta-propeller repeat protein [Flavobacterium procerum]|uniref:PQQ-binding-like beta-propeller repeat protein n=1 Tax=Flavobacterium procerum TaxID=1455569 RepID=A0ABV6BKK0_9FLAO
MSPFLPYIQQITFNLKKHFGLFSFGLFFIFSCTNKTSSISKTKADHETLLVATEGTILNYNIEKNKIAWQYKSVRDTIQNRNYFVLDKQQIYMPFESGNLINFDVNTGKIIWNDQTYGSDGEIQFGGEETLLPSLMPLYITKPFVDEENVVIPTMGHPEKLNAFLYCFNKKTGKKNWYHQLPTNFNHFAPVKCRNYYFVNSAVYLSMHSTDVGVDTSYGMYDHNDDKNRFERPIYNQMQSDDKNLYIGDEKGKFYCLELDENASVPNSDIKNPNNTFIKNPKVFKWTFSDPAFSFQKSHITFLEDHILYTEMSSDSEETSCFFALNTTDGKVKWKKIIKNTVLNWTLCNDRIVGYTEKTIFYMDKSGENYIEIPVEDKPISNIEIMSPNQFIYATKKGIEVFDLKTKKEKIIFSKSLIKDPYSNVQIKYIPKN